MNEGGSHSVRGEPRRGRGEPWRVSIISRPSCSTSARRRSTSAPWSPARGPSWFTRRPRSSAFRPGCLESGRRSPARGPTCERPLMSVKRGPGTSSGLL